jgi:hypothetical protein
MPATEGSPCGTKADIREKIDPSLRRDDMITSVMPPKT